MITNGDITSPEVARKVLEITGADGVMIGRAAQGQPWLPGTGAHYLETGELRADPSAEVILKALREHVGALSEFYGEASGVRIARKHLGWYLDRLAVSSNSHAKIDKMKEMKQRFNRLDSISDQLGLIDKFFLQSAA